MKEVIEQDQLGLRHACSLAHVASEDAMPEHESIHRSSLITAMASAGLHTTGSFSLSEVFSTIGNACLGAEGADHL